jgi:hypothetical protein
MMKSNPLLRVSSHCRVFHFAVIFFSINCLSITIFEGVSLLIKNKNISSLNLMRLPSHVVTSPKCQCHRSFHIFCTDLIHENDEDIEMINVRPAPHCHERDLSRRILTSHRKYRHESQEDNAQGTIGTTSSELGRVTIPESPSPEKKVLFIYVLYE